MSGIKLEVNVHIVTSATTSIQNLRTCIGRADIEIEQIVLNQIATSTSTLTHDEMELGVGLVDIGGGTTEVAIFERGSLWYTSIIPIGGDNFTNDIAVGLRTPIPEAEKIKKKFGCVSSPLLDEQETIEVPITGKIISVNVKPGDGVKEGDTLCILESMKMENPILAPVDGTISQVGVNADQVVKPGETIAVIEY